MKLQNPECLTAEQHTQVLQKLREVVHEYVKSSSRLKSIYVREWQFVYEEGVPTVQIFLDCKNENAQDKGSQVLAVGLDECSAVHSMLLESEVLDIFADDVAIEVSSAGVEPYLRDFCDFEAAIGSYVRVRFWALIEGKREFAGTLKQAVAADQTLLLVDDEGCEFSFPLAAVQAAQKLLWGLKKKKKKKKDDKSKKKRY